MLSFEVVVIGRIDTALRAAGRGCVLPPGERTFDPMARHLKLHTLWDR